MHRRLAEVLLLLFLAVIGVNWPDLPYNARLADLIFIPLAIVVLTLPGARWTWRRLDLAIAVYILGSLPAIVVSPDRGHSALELLREFYLAAIYVVCAVATRHGFARLIGRGLAAGGAMLSIAGLFFVALQSIGGTPWPVMGEVMQLPYLGDTLRLRALTASEAMLACVLTVAVPFAIGEWQGLRARLGSALVAATCIAAALTFSHAFAGFAVAALIAAWPSLAPRPLLRRLAIAGVMLIVLALNFAATISIRSVSFGEATYTDASQFHHAVDRRETRIGGATVVYDVMSYARIKQVAWQAFVAHPIAGIGLDQFHSATRQAFEAGALTAAYREIDPHSTLIGRLAETGIIGGAGLLFLWMVIASGCRRLLARGDRAAWIGTAAVAALVGLLVNSINADVMNFRFLWVLIGLVRALDVRSPDTQTSN